MDFSWDSSELSMSYVLYMCFNIINHQHKWNCDSLDKLIILMDTLDKV